MKENFETDREKEELRSLDLGAVAEEIKKYNDQYGLGSTLARGLLDGMKMEDDGEAEPEPEFDQERESESRGAFQKRVNDKYGILLEKAGIILEPVRGWATVYSSAGNVDTSVLRINLADSNRFVEYLSALTTETITPSQIAGLQTVIENLNDQLLEQYEANQADERLGELMKNTDRMVEQFRRLRPGDDNALVRNSRELTTAHEAFRGNYLKSYLAAKRQNLLAEVGGPNFGPSKWHTDSTEKHYEERWRNALNVVTELKRDPQAKDFYIDLVSNLVASARYAKEDLMSQKEEKHVARRQAMMKTIDEVLREIKVTSN